MQTGCHRICHPERATTTHLWLMQIVVCKKCSQHLAPVLILNPHKIIQEVNWERRHKFGRPLHRSLFFASKNKATMKALHQTALLLSAYLSIPHHAEAVMIGDEVCITNYIMDQVSPASIFHCKLALASFHIPWLIFLVLFVNPLTCLIFVSTASSLVTWGTIQAPQPLQTQSCTPSIAFWRYLFARNPAM